MPTIFHNQFWTKVFSWHQPKQGIIFQEETPRSQFAGIWIPPTKTGNLKTAGAWRFERHTPKDWQSSEHLGRLLAEDFEFPKMGGVWLRLVSVDWKKHKKKNLIVSCHGRKKQITWNKCRAIIPVKSTPSQLAPLDAPWMRFFNKTLGVESTCNSLRWAGCRS